MFGGGGIFCILCRFDEFVMSVVFICLSTAWFTLLACYPMFAFTPFNRKQRLGLEVRLVLLIL